MFDVNMETVGCREKSTEIEGFSQIGNYYLMKLSKSARDANQVNLVRLSFDEVDSVQNVLKRPSRPARNNLCPDFFRDCIVGVK